jgi:hypothetical protein
MALKYFLTIYLYLGFSNIGALLLLVFDSLPPAHILNGPCTASDATLTATSLPAAPLPEPSLESTGVLTEG